MQKLKDIGIIAFEKKKEIEETIQGIVSHPDFKGNRFYVDRNTLVHKIIGLEGLTNKAFLEKIDVLVSFGGDGTFISAARLVRGTGIPLIGVNMGSLGFLTDIPVSGVAEALRKILHGHYSKEMRLMFDVVVKRKGKTIVKEICLNDAVIKGSRLLKLTVSFGDELVSAYNADGLIVATPTGSTAYSMASGGPILYPTLKCAIITPICSHSLTQKPIVSSINRPITLRINDSRVKASLIVDGKNDYPLCDNDEVTVSYSRCKTVLLKPKGITYFQVLRKKLNWGSD